MTQYLNLPITNHTWVFFIVLAIILLAPMIFSKLRIPHLIGMILAGVLIGENGLNILQRDSSFELFGQVGLFRQPHDLRGLGEERHKVHSHLQP